MDMFYITHHPLASLMITLCSFSAFQSLQKKCNGHSLLNPVLWSIICCVSYVKLTGIDYATYMNGAQYINFLLGPVIVALAVPLYRFLEDIKKDVAAFIITVLIACPIAGFSAYFLMVLAHTPPDLQQAIIPKSASTPIAIEIAKKIGSIPSLTVIFVIMTGVSGSLFSTYFFKLLKIKNERAQGFAIGVASHGIGAARAFQISETAGTYAIIGMSLMGITSGIILPILVIFFL